MRDAALDTPRPAVRGATRQRAAGAPKLDGMLGEGVSPRPARPASRDGGPTSAAIAAQRLGGGRSAARRRDEPGLAMRLRARLPRIRPFKLLTVSAFSIALVGIVANAMVFQRGHHPAPLFGLGRSIDGQVEAPPRTLAERPGPAPAAPAPVDRTGTVAPPAAAPAVEEPAPRPAAPVAKPAPVHHAAAKPRETDAIGGLLSAPAPEPVAHPRPGHAGAKGASAARPVPGARTVPTARSAPAASAAQAKPAAKADQPLKAGDARPALAHPEAKSHLRTGASAHPRPHAGSTSGQAAAEARAELAPRAAAKTE